LSHSAAHYLQVDEESAKTKASQTPQKQPAKVSSITLCFIHLALAGFAFCLKKRKKEGSSISRQVCVFNKYVGSWQYRIGQNPTVSKSNPTVSKSKPYCLQVKTLLFPSQNPTVYML
jgi:hypothetical protein